MPRGRWRRVEKPCLLCGEPTREWEQVCQSCIKLYEKGKAYSQAESATPGTAKAFIARYWQFYHFHGRMKRHTYDAATEPGYIIVDRLLKLVRATKIPTEPFSVPPDTIGLADQREGYSSQRSWYLIHGEENAPEYLQEVYRAICDLMSIAYADGLRRGKSFVTDLVEGTLSVKDLENF